MTSCLAEYHAQRVLAEYGPGPLSRSKIIEICGERGVRLKEDRKITSPALYVSPPPRAIVHRMGAPAWVLAHELLHDYVITTDPTILANFQQREEEELCNRFATLLCGESPFLDSDPWAPVRQEPLPKLPSPFLSRGRGRKAPPDVNQDLLEIVRRLKEEGDEDRQRRQWHREWL